MSEEVPHPRAQPGGTSGAGARREPVPAPGAGPGPPTDPQVDPDLLVQVLGQVGDGVAVFDPDDRLVYVNPALAALHGCAVPDLLGHHVSAFIDDAERAVRERRADEARGVHLAHRQVSIRRWDGTRFEAQVTLSALRGADGSRAGTIVCVRDVTLERRLQERLAAAALHDALTGLPNRRLFSDRLEHALDGAARTGHAVAVLFVDLDGFKAVNDTHGHTAGDELLVQVAARFGACLRAGDTLARLGGDEFVVLLEGLEAADEPALTARRLLGQLRLPFVLEAAAVRVSASIGTAVSTAPGPGRAPAAPGGLLELADRAMYRAKRAGGGHVAAG